MWFVRGKACIWTQSIWLPRLNCFHLKITNTLLNSFFLNYHKELFVDSFPINICWKIAIFVFYFNSQTFDFRLFSLFCTKTTRRVFKCGSYRRHNQEGIWNPVLSYFGWRGSHRSYLDDMFQLCFSLKTQPSFKFCIALKYKKCLFFWLTPNIYFLQPAWKWI